MPPVYIQGSHWGHLKKIEDLLSPGDSTYFIFMGSMVDSISVLISDFSDRELVVGGWSIWVFGYPVS